MGDIEDIISEEINRVKEEKARVDKEKTEKEAREKYVEKQRKKERSIDLYFSDLEQTGRLRLQFSPVENTLGKTVGEGGEFPPKADEWAVEFSIGKDPKKFFGKFEEAFEHFQELYRKHKLEENREAYIDKEISKRNVLLKQSERRETKWLLAAVIGSIVTAVLGISAFFWQGIILDAQVALLALAIIAGGVTVIIGLDPLRDGIFDIHYWKKELQKLRAEKEKTPFLFF